jgi:arylsulfatase A-like enzyme
VAQVFESPRAGDFLVSATRGWDLRTHERVDHRSCHGTLHREHMQVPFAISHKTDDRATRSVDVFPTILNLFGKPVPPDLDGVSLV